MIWLSAAIVIATLIGAVAYVYPKVAFLSLQEAIIESQTVAEREKLAKFEASIASLGDVEGSDSHGYV